MLMCADPQWTIEAMKHQTDSSQVHSLIVHYHRKDPFYCFNSAKRPYLLSCSNIKVYFWNEDLFFPPLNWKGFQPCVKKSLQFLDIFFNLKNFNWFSLKIFRIYYGWMVDNFNFCALLVFPKFSIKSLHSGLPRWFSGTKNKTSICQCKRHKFDPWSSKIPHALEQLNLCTATIKPVL